VRQACEHSIVDGNHSAKMDRFELGACDRQTDRRTDGSQHCLLLPMDGGDKDSDNDEDGFVVCFESRWA